ncbi:hypothetical protein [uncultured Methanolobus sp.]|uniref:hypothetical protein n=1 Tax=uncultured Methanolobus sp. TaxID=218300 RepID=UPI0029C8B963|nr:hypothetical protein [uncultured Methanolobus sp.]
MNSDTANKKRCFSQDTRAYIPFAVIGMFILLFAVIVSVYIAKTDYELAEIIYTTDTTNVEETAVDFASADLARCLNYAGMEALVWQGEHPVIKPEATSNEIMESDGFSVAADSRDVEPVILSGCQCPFLLMHSNSFHVFFLIIQGHLS